MIAAMRISKITVLPLMLALMVMTSMYKVYAPILLRPGLRAPVPAIRLSLRLISILDIIGMISSLLATEQTDSEM